MRVPAETTKAVRARLRRIAGQAQAFERMLDEHLRPGVDSIRSSGCFYPPSSRPPRRWTARFFMVGNALRLRAEV